MRTSRNSIDQGRGLQPRAPTNPYRHDAPFCVHRAAPAPPRLSSIAGDAPLVARSSRLPAALPLRPRSSGFFGADLRPRPSLRRPVFCSACPRAWRSARANCLRPRFRLRPARVRGSASRSRPDVGEACAFLTGRRRRTCSRSRAIRRATGGRGALFLPGCGEGVGFRRACAARSCSLISLLILFSGPPALRRIDPLLLILVFVGPFSFRPCSADSAKAMGEGVGLGCCSCCFLQLFDFLLHVLVVLFRLLVLRFDLERLLVMLERVRPVLHFFLGAFCPSPR